MNDVPDAREDLREAVLGLAERAVGRCEVVRDHSWRHEASMVLRVRDGAGVDWFIKRHRDRDRYATEVNAYRRWVPALGDQAPRLGAVDDGLAAMVLSAVPGDAAPWPEPGGDAATRAAGNAERELQRQAGALLRRLHDAQPPTAWPDFAAAKIDEFDQLVPQASALLPAQDLEFARARVHELADLDTPLQVPCHRDYTMRNWLVGDGGLAVVDFELARLDVWANDLVRLYFGAWTDRPDLRDAFLDGYGRTLADEDRAVLLGCGALNAVWLTVKGREYGEKALEEGNRRTLQRLVADGGKAPGRRRP